MIAIKTLVIAIGAVLVLSGCDGSDGDSTTAPLHVLKARVVLNKRIKVIDRQASCLQAQVDKQWFLGCSATPELAATRSLFAVLPRSAEEFCLMPINELAKTQRQSPGFGSKMAYCERAVNLDMARIDQALDEAAKEAAVSSSS